MSAGAQQAKVLRIGIIQDGKIVQERLIKSGETVTVGESAKNTFVFPKTALNRAEFALFVCKGAKYELNFTEAMKGRISSGGAVVALDKLRSDPSVLKHGQDWKLPLTEQDRGKVKIDSVTVLFQFVSAPPQAEVADLRAMDFRARMLEEDDPIFLGFLAIWTALAAVLLIWVANTEPQAQQGFEEIPERFANLMMQDEPPDEPEPEPEPEVEADPNAEAESSEEAAPAPETEAKPKPEKSAQDVEAAKQEVMAKSLLLKMIGTRGTSSGGATAAVWGGEDSSGTIDLSGVSGVTADASKAGGIRGGTGTGPADKDIGELKGTGGGGTAKVKDTPQLQVQADVGLGSGEFDDDVGDAGAVKKVVQRNFGQLKYCYETELRSNPNLSGRVEVEWTVAGGRVTSVGVLANTTGNKALGDCIASKLKRWRGWGEFEGDVSWPFIFTQKG